MKISVIPTFNLALFAVILILNLNLLAQGSGKGFSKKFSLGEKDFGDYVGSEQNIIYQDEYGKLKSQDEKLAGQYINSVLLNSYDDQMSFFESELPAGIFCPDHILDDHFNSLQYYFRLLALSHLYEAIKLYERFGTCSFKLDEILTQCNPSSDWLKDIIKLAQIAPALKTSLIDESIYFSRRDKKWCESQNISCGKNKTKKIRKNYCQQDLKNFKLICSELDDLYGISRLALPYWLLKRTHITHRFDSEELALGCMRRFSQTMKNYEKLPKDLDSLFEPVYESLPKSHKEGGLFAYGSLQKYGELKKLFVDSFNPSNEVVAIKEKEVAALVVKQAPVIKRKKVSIQKLPVMEKKKTQPRHSAFYQACKQRNLYQLNEASVDMLKFHYDLVLTGEKKAKADKLLVKFRQRKVLESMKKYEKLGTIKAPVPLIFIKYLIDARDYQGLFNIIGVLGDSFFIQNDFDANQSECRLERSKLFYDKSKRSWQLSVVKSEEGNKLK